MAANSCVTITIKFHTNIFGTFGETNINNWYLGPQNNIFGFKEKNKIF